MGCWCRSFMKVTCIISRFRQEVMCSLLKMVNLRDLTLPMLSFSVATCCGHDSHSKASELFFLFSSLVVALTLCEVLLPNQQVAGQEWKNLSREESFLGKNLNYTLELWQKFDFQPSTIKPDNIGHSTIETGQIWSLELFPR